ncbi:hypothetical protein LCGC14_1041020 [marine sediment metagenome]|uniref:Uncharacterized protein n=1 Tax=marine sediment metagenome TaxID=412755 RepID=A0A0F9Q9X9_9ZZZZ
MISSKIVRNSYCNVCKEKKVKLRELRINDYSSPTTDHMCVKICNKCLTELMVKEE